MPESPAPGPTDVAVLLVDDRPENLQAFEAVLAPLARELDVRLLRASGADEALRHVLAEGDAIAVILLDVMMPGTDGIATARLIRERRATEHVPVIFVTALDADRRRVTEGYLSGAVDYLTKPVDPGVLAAKVRAFVELHRRRTEAAFAERRRFADRIAASEAVARASDARLRAALDSLPDAVYVYDAAWRWTYVNPVAGALLRRLGVDPATVPGRRIWEEIPRLRGSRIEREMRRARAERRVVEYEEHVAAFDAWFEQRIVPGPDDTLTVYSRDVTTRRRAEAALRASEARLRPVMASGIVGLFFWDVDGAVTEANDAFLAMLGYTRDELAAGAIDWRRLTPPEYADADAEKVAELLTGGAHGPYEKVYLARDGRPVPVLIASAFLDGSRESGVCLCIDLTERRRAEAERERAIRDEAALVDTVQRIGTALTSELDLDRLVQAVTDAATALTGAQFGALFYGGDPETADAGLTLYALAGAARDDFAGFPMPRNTHVFGPTFRGDAVVLSDDITADPRYGRMPPHHGMPPGHLPVRSYLAVPVRSRAGEVLGGLFFGHERPAVFTERAARLVSGIAGWAGVAMDNARLYAAERRAREEAEGARSNAEAARVRAEAADRAKSTFLATMSHELRTPLNAIIGYLELLAMELAGPVTPQQREFFQRLGASSAHLLGLVNDILDMSRIDAGRVRVTREPARTAAAIEAAISMTATQAEAKGIRVVRRGDDGDGVPYVGDEARVRQILVNLLSNAVKFTAPGGRVEVQSLADADADAGAGAERAGGGPWVAVRVSDTGIGIAPEDQEAIFAPFHQVDGRHARAHGGTGLGLAISRQLARLMGGDLTLVSAPNRGSTFTLWLPGPT